MFEWFTNQFSDPVAVALVLGARFLSYFLYSGLAAAAVGLRSRLTLLSSGLSVLSVLLTVLILHPAGLPNAASYLDILIHFTLPVLAGYAVYSNPTNKRWLSFSLLLVSTFFFLTLLLVLYGEGP
ncbi:hypothetical protein E6P09_12280 [Haloferax mediterranei ATCC 33500]|uniref:Uncharacterized protein n=1 Tax=Haloferax mediterranei (strain ATCC 33500 / DSM 1411 / JCM 8866 / NBRC 14739 / NCIMB 2177 / R-4) TaxID=523841 RepID=I3R8L0_HALMT|nr:hypothetical protein [Haloferax mediterranei]AFK20570.1 hypothetical protein HFX_2900 [Haloferax mediterranei ATCC 33500]AHZ23928.1 hypothetical protein BM92_15300 [Haloferax mediterranei ATCC 33500]MDX5986673.1 hypothetical protein [Haloferax mediterranei ATCC 33500]QCQ76005.1 hypothetical protein E6P09_12280 [Haloferax mediterranei ATCC 33500]